MGLAASQARLLTITARLADNELRSQTINNAKMRLATQSAQASDEYVSALNNAQLMFTNTNENGLSQTQALTFNSLTQYSQYNNQYGLVNSSGQTLVSEEDAKMFEANKTSLEGFLKAHGLEWETTYFDETSGNLVSKLQAFYCNDYAYIGNLFSGMNNEQLKNLYLDAISEEASIEAINYSTAARNYYNQIATIGTTTLPDIRNNILGSSTSGINEKSITNAVGGLGNAANVINEFLRGNMPGYTGILADETDGGAKFALNNLQNGYRNASNQDPVSIINDSAAQQLRAMVASLVDVGGKSGYSEDSIKMPAGTSAGTGIYYTNAAGATASYDLGTTYNFSISYTDTSGATKTADFKIVYNKQTWSPTGQYYVDNDGNTHQCMKLDSTQSYIYCSDPNFKYGGNDINNENDAQSANNGEGNLKGTSGFSTESQINAILHNISGATIEGSCNILHYYNLNPDLGPGDADYRLSLIPMMNQSQTGVTGNAVYQLLADSYFNILFNNQNTFDAMAYLSTLSNLPAGLNNSSISYQVYQMGTSGKLFDIDPNNKDDREALLDFDKLIQTKGITLNNKCNSYMRSVLGVYMVEKMVDVLGEPKYAWVDKSLNPTTNPDSKAQWLSNLFNRMQKGYKVLENGLANSKEWLEHAFESGLVTMEQVDLSYNWVSLDYKSCANINEDTDNSALVAKAEAKYNRAMNDIKQKDSLYDLQLKNIDTEHSSLQTEYDVIKGVISKNIERTMKFDQSA